VQARADDLLVRSLKVQGGEADIGGERTAFARLVMSGVEVGQLGGAGGPMSRATIVLKLDDADALATELRSIVNALVRSTPTPEVPALGTWSWTRTAPLGDDLLVARASAVGTADPIAIGVRFTVRAEFAGIFLRGLSSANPPVHVQGAVFQGARQVQALLSSLRRVVSSALERRRTELYLAGGEGLAISGVWSSS